MKAIRCKSYGLPDTLVLEDVSSPQPGPNEILINVKACGVNFPDTLIIQGKYQFKPELPFTPGSDVAGAITAVGENVTHFNPGDSVFGVVTFGGFAEEVLLSKNSCFPIPKGISFEHAASFMLAYGTSYHALKDRAKLQKDETLLVLGAAGGVGLTAIELGKPLRLKGRSILTND